MVNNSPVLEELHQAVARAFQYTMPLKTRQAVAETQLRTPIRFQKFAGA